MDNYKELGLPNNAPMYMVDKMYKALTKSYKEASLDTSKIDKAYFNIKNTSDSNRKTIDDYISTNHILSLYEKFDTLYKSIYNTCYFNELDNYFISICYAIINSLKEILKVNSDISSISKYEEKLSTIFNFFLTNVKNCSKDLFFGITSTLEYKTLYNKLSNVNNAEDLFLALVGNINIIKSIFEIDNILKKENPIITINQYTDVISLSKETSKYQCNLLSKLDNLSIKELYIVLGNGRYNKELLNILTKVDNKALDVNLSTYEYLGLDKCSNIYQINGYFNKKLNLANGLYKINRSDDKDLSNLLLSSRHIIDNYVYSLFINYSYDFSYLKDKLLEVLEALEVEDNIYNINNELGNNSRVSILINKVLKQFINSLNSYKEKVRNAKDISTLISLYNSYNKVSLKYVHFFKNEVINIMIANMVSETLSTNEFVTFIASLNKVERANELFSLCLLNVDDLKNIIMTSDEIIGDIDLSNEDIRKYFNLYNKVLYELNNGNPKSFKIYSLNFLRKFYKEGRYLETFKTYLKKMGISYPDGRRLTRE